MIRALMALCVLATATAQAAAQENPEQPDVRVFGLVLPAPNGYCVLSSAEPADRDLIDTAKELNAGFNSVLSIFAECGQLNAMRASGGALSNYAMYLLPVEANLAALGPSKSLVIDDLASALEETDIAGLASGTVQDRFEQADLAIEFEEFVELGLIHRDGNRLFSGLIARVAVDDAELEMIAAVSATTFVTGRVVTLNLYAPYEGPQTIEALLAQQQVNIERLIDTN